MNIKKILEKINLMYVIVVLLLVLIVILGIGVIRVKNYSTGNVNIYDVVDSY